MLCYVTISQHNHPPQLQVFRSWCFATLQRRVWCTHQYKHRFQHRSMTQQSFSNPLKDTSSPWIGFRICFEYDQMVNCWLNAKTHQHVFSDNGVISQVRWPINLFITYCIEAVLGDAGADFNLVAERHDRYWNSLSMKISIYVCIRLCIQIQHKKGCQAIHAYIHVYINTWS